jgi:hypothetical protein
MVQRFLITGFLVAVLVSCVSKAAYVQRGKFDVSKVPEDFNPKKHVLLVAEMPRLNNPEESNPTVTRKLDAALRENYPFPYEIVPLRTILSNEAKYSDTSKYKYAMLNTLTSITRTTEIRDIHNPRAYTLSPSARTTYIAFSFMDRSNGTILESGHYGNNHIDVSVMSFVELLKRANKL